MSHTEPTPAPAAAKEAVLVSGMHRSGAAVVSRALSYLGYSQPQQLAEGVSLGASFHESTRIMQLNEEMISSLGWSSEHTPLLSRDGSSSAETEAEILQHLSATWLERAREAIRGSYRPDAARVVSNDPRVSLFPAFWQAAFEAEGFTVRHLLAFRDPLEAAQSLQEHRGMSQPAAFRAWLTYNLRPLGQVEVAATLDYGDLVRSPKRAVNAAATALGASELDEAAAEELRDYIAAARSEPHTEAELEEARVPEMVRSTYALLRAWRTGPNPRLERQAEKLRQNLADAQMLFGRVRRLPPLATNPALYVIEAPAAAGGEQPSRALVLHYHLFKNAGTSVDVVLEGNFGQDWREVEFASRGKANQAELQAWITDNPSVKALSSRSARGPLPRVDNVAIVPIIFVRHPIDRIRSAYEFERRQAANTPAARIARRSDFAGYIRARLERGDRQANNFQTGRLASFGRGGAGELEQALITLDSLPFIGLVEDFAGSMVRLEAYVRETFPSFRAFGAKANVWREGRTLEERLDDARAELGSELWNALVAANRDDLKVFATVAARYDVPTDAVLPD